MRIKQQKFCDAYIRLGNATKAYIEAGYSKKGAGQSAEKLLRNTEIKKYIEKRFKELTAKNIAPQEEVLEYLTQVMRGESQSEVLAYETKNGVTKPKLIKKAPDEKERLRAAEDLGKRYRLFTEKIDLNVETPVFSGEEDLED